MAEHVPALQKALAAAEAWEGAHKIAQKQLREAEADGARIISGVDPDYPRLLLETYDDPFLLFVKGKLAPDPEKSVAVIGTREPTTHGELIAKRIAGFFAGHGWSIVSGLAIGCDAIAHKTALEQNAHTVAVLAHGLHTIAPTRHKALAQEIIDAGGALITEYRYGQGIQKQQYVKRDRIQAAMAQGVVMVQSDLVGGSLYASRASIEYGRWLAVPVATDRDQENGEPKVQANLLLASDQDRARADLLRCPPNALRKVFILRSKEDYAQLLTGEPTATSVFPKLGPEVVHPSIGYPEPSKPDDGELVVQALLARYRYVRSKIAEVQTLQQCLSDPTTSLTTHDLDHELETLLLHLDRFAVLIENQVAKGPVIEASARLRKEVATLVEALNPLIHSQVPQPTLSAVFVLFRTLAEAAFHQPALADTHKVPSTDLTGTSTQ
ncbi:DNA-processing protein DprA [Variovorax sp. MHTC-1]|uniref:DNA-processing protein DprA n=1 Tax=Variovorax sp. MHTC-1 TaxID=2495593 RepID=UPI001C8EDC3E|nr:DNA-processing protein DprA [Variovorax sp. MHTC-1]